MNVKRTVRMTVQETKDGYQEADSGYPLQCITESIQWLRGRKVILSHDLALVYGIDRVTSGSL